MIPSPQAIGRVRHPSLGTRLAAVLKRWFHAPAQLEKRFEQRHRACRSEPRRWGARCVPVVVGLEGRESPQFMLGVALAAGATAAAVRAAEPLTTHVSAYPSPWRDGHTAQAGSFVAHFSTAPDARHVAAFFAQATQAGLLETWDAIDSRSLDSLGGGRGAWPAGA